MSHLYAASSKDWKGRRCHGFGLNVQFPILREIGLLNTVEMRTGPKRLPTHSLLLPISPPDQSNSIPAGSAQLSLFHVQQAMAHLLCIISLNSYFFLNASLFTLLLSPLIHLFYFFTHLRFLSPSFSFLPFPQLSCFNHHAWFPWKRHL